MDKNTRAKIFHTRLDPSSEQSKQDLNKIVQELAETYMCEHEDNFTRMAGEVLTIRDLEHAPQAVRFALLDCMLLGIATACIAVLDGEIQIFSVPEDDKKT